MSTQHYQSLANFFSSVENKKFSSWLIQKSLQAHLSFKKFKKMNFDPVGLYWFGLQNGAAIAHAHSTYLVDAYDFSLHDCPYRFSEALNRKWSRGRSQIPWTRLLRQGESSMRDIIILNTGAHWKLHDSNAVENSKGKNGYIIAVYNTLQWLKENFHGHIFYRELVNPDPFFRNRTAPLTQLERSSIKRTSPEFLQYNWAYFEWMNSIWEAKSKELEMTNFHTLGIKNLSELRGDAVTDELHYCIPGVQDIWNQVLFQNILDLERHRVEVDLSKYSLRSSLFLKNIDCEFEWKRWNKHNG